MVKMINNMLKEEKNISEGSLEGSNASPWKEGRGVLSVKVEEG
jgi:hypothetical protein